LRSAIVLSTVMRPHVLGIDDGPFHKGQAHDVPIVGVMMEGSAIVEGVALTTFPVDGDGVTTLLAEWIESLRWKRALQAVMFGGATIAGLAIIDIEALAERTGLPCISVTRRPPSNAQVRRALASADLTDRAEQLDRLPPAVAVARNLYVSSAGTTLARTKAIVHATSTKSKLPEPLRVAHLVAAALERGQSRGRA
jgi:endonuclease V-like protein UPF0215 family